MLLTPLSRACCCLLSARTSALHRSLCRARSSHVHSSSATFFLLLHRLVLFLCTYARRRSCPARFPLRCLSSDHARFSRARAPTLARAPCSPALFACSALQRRSRLLLPPSLCWIPPISAISSVALPRPPSFLPARLLRLRPLCPALPVSLADPATSPFSSLRSLVVRPLQALSLFPWTIAAAMPSSRAAGGRSDFG